MRTLGIEQVRVLMLVDPRPFLSSKFAQIGSDRSKRLAKKRRGAVGRWWKSLTPAQRAERNAIILERIELWNESVATRRQEMSAAIDAIQSKRARLMAANG